MSTVGGANPGAPGVAQPTAGDGVNTENGDFTDAEGRLRGPDVRAVADFTRVDHSARSRPAADQERDPGPMGYGWTDNWATSLASW